MVTFQMVTKCDADTNVYQMFLKTLSDIDEMQGEGTIRIELEKGPRLKTIRRKFDDIIKFVRDSEEMAIGKSKDVFLEWKLGYRTKVECIELTVKCIHQHKLAAYSIAA